MDKEQLKADDWMCEHINKILNEFNRKIAPDIEEALSKISVVMIVANRRRGEGEEYARIHFTDNHRNNFDYRTLKK